MNFIKEKKINKYIVICVLALSFGFTGMYNIRGLLALFTIGGIFKFNDVWAFILAALSGILLYEVITMFLSRMIFLRLGATKAKDFRYVLRFFFIPANILSGALKTLYLFFPFVFPYGELFFDFIFAAVFFGLFIRYCCKNYCSPEEYGRVTMSLGSSFLCLYGLIAVVSLVSGVLA